MSDDLLKRADALALHTYWAQTPIANVVIDLAARIRELEADLATARAAGRAVVAELRVALADLDAARAERDAVAVANCPRLCAEFCNEHQTQRALERAEADLDAARAALVSVQRESDQESARAGKCADDLARVTQERDALAAAMPSEGTDAALAYAAMRAERDDYKAQAKEYWDIGLKRERARDALIVKVARCERLLREIANGRVGAGGAQAYFAGKEPKL